MRRIFLTLLLFALAPFAKADHVIVTGGPALRQWEDLRVKQDQHDRWWANFVRASTLRMVEIRKAYGPNAPIVWIVYRPGYQTRSAEDGKPYTTWLADRAAERNATLKWVSSSGDFVNALNSQPRGSIETFDYFGHSNKFCFMLDYSNGIMGASTAWFHENDISRVRRNIFAKNSYCKSWGCHTGESMSKVWKSRFGLPLEGAVGPTDYVVVGQGKLPVVHGRWAR
ncbi:hypothetical protein HNR46_003386 [Haloferula luteola]|uniref:Uncharacterized protein n=1 Tax=Haloferula luteola TaxID=595692 RepID=A0A840V664_9BACT|nr:hypothetical protein [Haloferula luteola]MBB5353133.1 hypothetical protein [Haloferula luteola]